MYKKHMISQDDNSKTKTTVRGTLKLFRTLHAQSILLYPLPEGSKGPKGSAARFMIMAAIEKLRKHKVFDEDYLIEINPYV